MRFPGVREALAVEIPAQETNLAKQERIAAYKSASDKAYSILIEACTDSSIGQIVMVAHYAADPELWANNLSKMLKLRFTLQATKRVAKCVTAFNLLKMEAGETGAMFMDRYNQKVSEIMSIDARQIPTNETRVTLLMNAIRRAFPMVYSQMERLEIETIDKGALEPSFAKWITECEQDNILGASKQKVEVELDEAVAQFVSLSSAAKFVKKPKRKFQSGGEESERIKRCWVCESTKHLKNDCPDRPPDGENSPRGEKKWDGEKKSKFVKKFESSPKKERKEFPLRSAMKGKNKSRSSNNFFDSNGDGDDSGESSSMIFCCEIPDEELNNRHRGMRRVCDGDGKDGCSISSSLSCSVNRKLVLHRHGM